MTAGDDDLVVGDDDALRSRLAAMELELQRRAAWRRYATACGGAQADQAVFDAAWCAYLADRDAFLRRWRNVLALHAIALAVLRARLDLGALLRGQPRDEPVGRRTRLTAHFVVVCQGPELHSVGFGARGQSLRGQGSFGHHGVAMKVGVLQGGHACILGGMVFCCWRHWGRWVARAVQTPVGGPAQRSQVP